MLTQSTLESFRKDDGRTRGRHSSTKIDLRMPDPSHLSVLDKIFDRIWLKRAFAKTTDTLEKVIRYENRSAHARPPASLRSGQNPGQNLSDFLSARLRSTDQFGFHTLKCNWWIQVNRITRYQVSSLPLSRQLS